MMFFTYYLNSSIRLFSDSLTLSISSLIVVVKSVCVTYGYLKGDIPSVVVSVDVVGPDPVFVEGYMTGNIYWVGLVKCSE